MSNIADYEYVPYLHVDHINKSCNLIIPCNRGLFDIKVGYTVVKDEASYEEVKKEFLADAMVFASAGV